MILVSLGDAMERKDGRYETVGIITLVNTSRTSGTQLVLITFLFRHILCRAEGTDGIRNDG